MADFPTHSHALSAPALFTPPSLPLPRVPLVPPHILQAYSSFIETDTRFRAAARLLQTVWREAAGLQMGLHFIGDGRQRAPIPLGSRLDPIAARAGRNFLTPQIHALVRRELALSEEGALFDADRLYGNLLSSMPLSFNLLGPMALDLSLATAVWQRLLPGFVHTVTGISFEHSPGRGDAQYLKDGTAVDVIIQVVTPDGEPATIFVEVKYSEAMTGPAAPIRPRYDEASRQVRLFRDPDNQALRSLALEQLWREAMLAQLAVEHGQTGRAMFVAIGPQLNRRFMAACRAFTNELVDPTGSADPTRVGFLALTLETIVTALGQAGATDLAEQLWRRYLDFDQVLRIALTDPSPDDPTPSARVPTQLPAPDLPSDTASSPAPEINTNSDATHSIAAGARTPPPRREREKLPQRFRSAAPRSRHSGI